MEALGGGEGRYSTYSFTTWALDGGEWSASRPGRAFIPEENMFYYQIQIFVDMWEKLFYAVRVKRGRP
jgi:hypothetical protein